MTTNDADSGRPPGMKGSPPGPRQAAEPELDAYGVPVKDRPPEVHTYLLALAGLIASIVPVVLAVTHSTHRPPGYQIAFGMLSANLGLAMPLFLLKALVQETSKKHRMLQWMIIAGSLIALGGMLALAKAAGWNVSDAGGGG